MVSEIILVFQKRKLKLREGESTPHVNVLLMLTDLLFLMDFRRLNVHIECNVEGETK